MQRKPYYLTLLALFISGAGSGLSQVAVYGQLGLWHAETSSFVIAFALSVLPGLFCAEIANRLSKILGIGKILLIAQAIGLFGLLFPVLGIQLHSPFLLLISEFTTALSAGMTYPAFQILTKRSFHDDDVCLASKLDTLVFSGQVILGSVIGALLFSRLSATLYFTLDGLSFVLAGVILLSTVALSPKVFGTDSRQEERPLAEPASAQGLSLSQYEALAMLPMLGIVCSFGIALLPGEAQKWGILTLGSWALNPGIIVLVTRSLGQLLGGAIVPARYLSRCANSRAVGFVLLGTFVGLYALAAQMAHPVFGAIAVLLAHVASNAFFVLAMFRLQRSFEADQIGWASAREYQFFTLATFGTSLAAVPVSHLLGSVPAMFAGACVVPLVLMFGKRIVREGARI